VREIWEKRYSATNYAYGKEPNHFLKIVIDALPSGIALFPAEGEGRNAVYAAKMGWQVTAVDFSEEARKKALTLAKKNEVSIDFIVKSMEHYTDKIGKYDLICLIFAHFAPEIRTQIHQRLIKYLKKGGLLIMEAFSKEQINYTSGGPKSLEMLYSKEEMIKDFEGYNIYSLREEIINLDEGFYHQGKASIIRMLVTNFSFQGDSLTFLKGEKTKPEEVEKSE